MVVTKLIQVTNISPAISEEQMLTLFGFVGKIEAMCMYPSLQNLEAAPDTPKICYIKFFDATCVGVSQYLTNTVFNDRALVVTPVEDGQIPEEEKAKEMAAQVGFPPAVTKPPDKPKSEVVNLLEGTSPNQVIVSHDPHLEELGLPKYPPLPSSFEGPVIEEIRRTVLIIDIEETVTAEELIQFYANAGDIKYIKFCSRSDGIRYALMEFTEQPYVVEALKMNGQRLRGKCMKVYHSTQAITKPETKSNEVAQREVVEALTRVKEAESLISAAIDPQHSFGKSKKDGRSKSPRRSRLRRSRSRRRSRSSHRRRASSRKRSRSRSRSRSYRNAKSKSPKRHRKDRFKSPQRSQRKSRSRSPKVKKTSRSKSPRSKRKSRSKTPSRRESNSRSKSPVRDRRRSRTRSPSKSKRKSRSRSPRAKRNRSRSPKSKGRSSSKSKTSCSKLNPSRGLGKSDRSPERRNTNDGEKRDKKRGRDADRGSERNKDKRDSRHNGKAGGSSKYKESVKGGDRDYSKSKSKEDEKNGKENGCYSSQTKEMTLGHAHSSCGSIVIGNGVIEDGAHSEDVEKHNTAPFSSGMSVSTSENDHSVLQENVHCDGPILDNEGMQNEMDMHSHLEASAHQQSSETSVSRSRSPSCSPGSLSSGNERSSHSPPNLADCDTRSCSPARP